VWAQSFHVNKVSQVTVVTCVQGMDFVLMSGEYFINSTGSALPQNAILHRYTQGGRNVTTVVTPRVKSAAQVQLGCNTLPGAELEDDGGDGTAGSHWEQRLFEGGPPLWPHWSFACS
jgi:hypothetical protein